MQIHLQGYITGFRRTLRELPSVLEEWSSLDPELCDAYTEQLLWMLQARDKAKAQALEEGRGDELASLLEDAKSVVEKLAPQLEDLMRIPRELMA